MKALNSVKFQFPSKSVNEGFARSTVAAFAAQLDPTLDEIADLKTAVSEAVTNCIVHGYPEDIGMITITASIYEGNTLRVVVADRGVGIENVEKAMEPMYTTGGPERAGLGFAVMESFTDKMKVSSKPGKGTRVTMTKRMGSRENANHARGGEV
ncbi:MAG TPA: anti-sigma F factor [Candidatus Ruthenibacterium avium]|uniref:Anti-sigma F factor n=1 Tax=Candidatus Ruthenibacterium avium TaxID=2838751 RepID=A0A9D2S072_9FIRM|nr:anti-sigma F factor [Candidatus Ruthenibacterium avium]